MKDAKAPARALVHLLLPLAAAVFAGRGALAQTAINATDASGGGNWNVAATWNCPAGPSPCIPNDDASYTFTVAVNTGTVILNTPSSTQAFVIDSLNVATGATLTETGGSLLTVNGTVTSSGTLNLGDSGITSPTELIAAGLSNTGTVNITGTITVEASLQLTGPASASPFLPATGTLSAATYNLSNDAVIEYGGPGITSIGSGVTVHLNGAGASLDATGLTANNASTANTNSALDTLASNTGTLDLENGASVITNSGLGLVNTGTIEVDQNTQTSSGGSNFGVGGLLTNNGQITIGNGQDLTSAVTASVDGLLDNTGTLSVHGNIVPASPVSASLEVAGGAFSAGIPTQAFTVVNSGTVNLASDAQAAVSGTYENLGTTNVDTVADYNPATGKAASGGSVLDVSGVLSNSGHQLSIGPATVSLGGGNATVNLGNASLTLPTEITAAGLNNLGTINLTGAPGVQALLELTGPASASPFVQPPGILDAGTYNLTNDAVLEYGGPGIQGIGAGVTVNLDGAGASIEATSLTPNNSATADTNSALDTLAGNAGTLELTTGASVATNSGLNLLNTATLDVDQSAGGGSRLGIGGTLENAQGATLNIGNGSIAQSTTVTAAGFSNFGTLNLTGTATTSALLDVTGAAAADPFVPASGVLASGIYNLTNEAQIEYAGPGIGEIGPGVTLNLNGTVADVSASGLTPNTASGTNSALDTLAANAGTFQLSNGGSVSTNAGLGLINSGVMDLDASGQGGSTVATGGTLTNSFGGEILLGNGNITKPTTVTVNGSLEVFGGSGVSCQTFACGPALLELNGAPAVQAALAVTGAAPDTLTGIYSLTGDALLKYGSGGITAIAGALELAPASLTLVGPNARIALAGSTSASSALAGLSMNGGSLTLVAGAQVTTSPAVNFVNSGSVSVDGQPGESGGSALNIGGTIENTSGATIDVGNGNISASSKIAAAGFALDILSGNVTVTGQNPGSGSAAAVLSLANGITGIAYNDALTLSNSNSYVALSGTSPLSNSGLSGLASNDGTFTIAGGAAVSTNPGLDFNNNGGVVTVDASAVSSGGATSFTIGGALDNSAALDIVNSGSTGSSTAEFTAAGLDNSGTIQLTGGSSSHTATLTLNGGAVNAGTVDIGDPNAMGSDNFASLEVAVGSSYTQEAGINGQTIVNGVLRAGNVQIAGGLIEGAGMVEGAVVDSGAIEGGLGNEPGGLAISGNYTQTASGILYQSINGISSGQFSSLNVGGNATAGGLLAITTPGYGFSFAQGQTFDILNITSTSGSVSGSFSGLAYDGLLSSGPQLNLGDGLALDLTYNSNDAVLSVVNYTVPTSADIWDTGTGTWSATNTANWASGAPPSSASDVILGTSTGGTVTLDPSVSGTTINSLTVTGAYTLAYGAPNESLATNTAINIDRGGEVDLENSGDTLATGKGGGNGNLTSFGTLDLANGATATVGGVLENFATLGVTNGAALTVTGDFINGSPGGRLYQTGAPLPTVSFEAAGVSTINGNLTNNSLGTLNIDEQFSAAGGSTVGGGSTLNVAGTLANAGNMTIGSSYINSPVTVTVGNLLNTNELNISGASAQFAFAPAPANVASTLNVTGSWIPSSGILASGLYQLTGDAQIDYAGAGITTIASPAEVFLISPNASIGNSSLPASGAGVNNAFDSLSHMSGRLSLAAGAQLETSPGVILTDDGSVEVDANYQGGSTLTVGGTMIIEHGDLIVGNGAITSPTTVNVAGLYDGGEVLLEGGTSTLASLNVTGPAGSFVPSSGALNQGTYQLSGDAELAYAGPGISTLGTGAWVDLIGSSASINDSSLAPNNGSTNSALDTLTANAGLLDIGSGASVQSDVGLGLTNTGNIQLVDGTSATPTSLGVGGTLTNNGQLEVQAGSSGTTLTAAGFSNSGTVQILGTPSNQALLDVTATASVNPFVSASGVLSPGIYELESNAVLEYSGPGISSISNGAAVQILGPYGASITDTSLTPLTSRGVNSALDTLSSNAGNLLLDSTAVDTSGNLVNSGSMEVTESGTCAPNSFGGCTIAYPPASLNVAGTLTNTNPSGAASQNAVHGIGISSGATVSAGGLVNSGSMDITGFNSAAAVSSLASSGPATNSGTIYVLSGGQLTAAGALTNTDTGVLFLGRGSAVYNGSSYTPVATAVSAGGFDNAGAVNISGGNGSSQPGATLTITGSGNSYTQTAPLAVTTVGGTLVAQAVNIQGGLLQGNGTINGDVTNAATVVAMNSAYPYFITPSVLTVSGNYTQTSSGVLDELIQGSVTRGAQYNAINVSGSVTLAGALDVTTLNGFTLAANQSYDLMNFTPGALTGTFGTLQYNNIAASAGGTGLLNLGNQLALSINYDNSTGEVVLDVVTAQPAPTSDGWIGNTDNWSNPVDWSTGQTPLPSQDVTVGTGSGGTVAYNEAASTVNSLTVESGSGNGGTYALTFGGNDALNVTKTVSISTPSTPSGSSLELMASGATLSTGGNLTIYSGGLYVANGGAVTVGAQGAPADLINDSSLYVDAGCAACQGTAASTGGGNLTVSGTLTNNGDLRIGNGGSITSPGGITTQSMVSAQSLSATSGATTLANTLSGNVLIAGENPAFGSAPAVVRLGTSITSIEPPPGGAGSLTLMNANSFITTDTSGPYTNDGISALANIGAGATLSLDAGASATIGTSLTNAGAISLVTQFNNGSTSAPYVSDLPTTLTVAGLSNSGAISLTGCLTSGCTAPALLDITGPSGSFIPADGSLSAGNYQLAGNAELEYNGPGISSIGHGVYLTLAGQNGAIPSISVMNNGVTGSAFGTLTGNAGYLAFSGGASITTSVGLTNTGIMSLSSGSGQPPTSLNVGGTLINGGGNPQLGGFAFSVENSASVVATGLNNSGTLDTYGSAATLTINGAAENSGLLAIGGAAGISGALTNDAGGQLGVGGYMLQGTLEGGLGAGTLAAGGVSNSGAVVINANRASYGTNSVSTLTVSGTGNTYTQTGSSASTLVMGELVSPAVNVNGGLLEGTGTIAGDVRNAAAVAGGTGSSSPGLLTITGNYVQAPAGALDEIIGGAATRGTGYSAINVSGAASLDGTLNVSAVNGFAFAANESLDILNFAPNQLSGGFATLQYGTQAVGGGGIIDLGNDTALALAYDSAAGEVLLDVVTPDDWTGGSGNWSTGSWSTGLPGATERVVIGTGTGGAVTLDQSASVYDLTLQTGASGSGSPVAYSLGFDPAATLTTAGGVSIGSGTALDVEAAGAALDSGGGLTNAGLVHLESGGTVSVGTAALPASLDNAGTILVDSNLTGGSSLRVSGTLSDAGGQITVGNTGITSAATLAAGGFAGDTLTGTVQVAGSGASGGAEASLVLGSGITGIAANSSLLLVNSNSQVNLAGGAGANSALTGLTNVAGALQLESGAAVSTNGALDIAAAGRVGVDDSAATAGGSSLMVNGTLSNNGTFALGTGGASIVSDAIASGFDNSGTASIGGSANEATLVVNGPASNSGTVSIGGGAEINVTGSNAYVQSAGATTVDGTLIASGITLDGGAFAANDYLGVPVTINGGTFTANGTLAGPVTLNSGTLSGVGTIDGTLANASGTVQASPGGNYNGTLTLNGSYTQGAGGTLGVLINQAPYSALTASVLNAGGTGSRVSLNGTLDVYAASTSGYTVDFTTGQSFDIINAPANGLSGTFSALECGGPNCVSSNNAGLILVSQTGMPGSPDLGLLPVYEPSLGKVLLDVITPPAPAVTWQGGSGNWSDATEWNNGGYTPMGYQDVTLGAGAGGTVTYDETNASINSLTVSTAAGAGYTLSFNPATALNVATTVAINSNGAIDLAATGASLAGAGGLSNAGTVNVANGGSLAVGSLSAPAGLTNSPSGTLEVDAGTSSGGSSVTVFGFLSNTGAVDIGNATLTAPTTVEVGGLENGGSLSVSGTSALNSATLSVAGNAVNTLTANVGPFANLTVTGSSSAYTQSCPGVICLASTTVDGSLTAPAVNNDAGVLQGEGTINGAVTNGGIVAGGSYLGSHAPGTLTIDGSYAQTATGVLEEDIASSGTPGTDFSVLSVNGPVQLGGALQINALNGFTLAAGQTFDIMNFTSGGLAGEFATLGYGAFSGSGNGVVGIGNNLDVSVNYDDAGGDLVLQVGALDTWNGTTDLWSGANDGSNWSTGAKPTAAEDVLIGAGSGGTVTYNGSGETIQSLTVQPGTSSGYTLAFNPGGALQVSHTVSIDTGGEIAVQANGAALTTGGSLANAGTLTLGQDTQIGQGGPAGQGGTITVGSAGAPADLTNSGTINIDPASAASPAPPTGGSTLSISGTLSNGGGTINIGNTGISSESLVSAASLSASSGTKTLANTLDGTVLITGEDPTKGTTAAVLEVGTAITGIAKSGSLTLANSNSFITTGTSGSLSNDGLAGLASNQGSLALENGAQAAIGAAALTNQGSIGLDGGARLTLGSSNSLSSLVNSGSIRVGEGAGGSTLTVNGLLDDSGGTVGIGNVEIMNSDTMSIQSFASKGVNGAETANATLNGNVDIAGSSTGTAAATLYLDSGLTSIASGSSLILYDANAHLDLSNKVGNNSALSSLAKVSGTLALESGASVTTSGALSVASGGRVGVDDFLSSGGSKLAVSGTLDNGGSLDLGTAGGTPATVSAAGFANSGTATLGGPISGTAALTVNGNAANSGTITIGSGSEIQVAGGNSFSQSGGSLTIEGGGSLSAASSTQTGGTTLVNGTLTAPTSGVTVNGGTLAGTGTIVASVSNASGTVAASPDGASPGTLAVNGSYTQASGGTLDEFVGGTSAGQFSVINLTGGSLSLAGTLAVSTLNGFALAGGQSFDIINFPAGSLSGTFGQLAYGGVVGSGTSPLDIENGALALSLQYGGTGNDEVILKVTSVATNDVWKGNGGDWYSDPTDWSTQAPPSQPSASPPQGGPQDTLIGEGSTGGTVTLGACDGSSYCGSNPNVTEVKSLTVEANPDPNEPGANYVLDVSGGVTLTVDKTTTINPGGEIDLQAAGATLTSAGSMSNGGTLTLAKGGSVTVGTAAAPANFTNAAGGSAGTVNVDTTGSGGSTLTVNGSLTNDVNGTLGTIDIGNASLTANATVRAPGTGSLDGIIDITGPAANAQQVTAPPVTLKLSFNNPDQISVTMPVPVPSSSAQAALSLSTSPVTSILSTGSLTLSGADAFVELTGATGSNSALTGLTSNAGKLELDGGAQVITGVDSNGNPTTATFSNTGSVTTGNSTTISSNGNLILAGTGGLSNSGTVTVNGDTATQVLNGEFLQTGSGATTTVSGKSARLQVFAAGVSQVGMDIQSNTTLNVIKNGYVCVGIGGTGCSVASVTGASSSTSIKVNLTNEGTIDVGSGSDSTGEMQVNGDIKNTGDIYVAGQLDNSGTVTQSGQAQITGKWDPTAFTQTGGSTELSGTLVSPTVDVQGGSLGGGGTIQGDLVNNALVSPGGSSTLTVDGNYIQGPDGTLLIDISSLTDFSSLDISGNAALGGTVQFDFLNGYVPQANDTFAFLDAASVSGDFSSVDFAGIDCASCTAGFNGTDFRFSLDTGGMGPTSTTPEPGALGLLVTGLLALAWARRRRRTTSRADAGVSGL